jgi:hypothetical protein
MHFNDDAPSLDALVTRGKRDHNKNKNKEQSQDARHARIRRKALIEENENDEDYREYVSR